MRVSLSGRLELSECAVFFFSGWIGVTAAVVGGVLPYVLDLHLKVASVLQS